MPHFALHVLLASRAAEMRQVDSWFSRDPDRRNAFLHGAIGPDMGFFPGADYVLSRAAHGSRSGDLIRALHRTAETPRQRAFVRGWLTHMLGDILIHPIINQAAGELLEREGIAATPAAQHHSHIRVELGLDAVYVARHRALRRIRLQPFFEHPTTRWITAAVQAVYDVRLERSAVLRSHHQVVRLQRPLLLLERLIGAQQRDGHPLNGVVRRGLLTCRRLTCRHVGPHSPAAGFLATVRPSEGMMRAVDGVIADFPTAFPAFRRLILEGDLNYNLDTGRLEAPRGTPTTRRYEGSPAAIGLPAPSTCRY